MKITDKQAIEAMQILKEYCEQNQECEGCNAICSELKKGQSPCYFEVPEQTLS